MALWWIVHEQEGARRVFVQEATTQLYARLIANMAGFEGTFVECHELDRRMVKKVPKRMLSRVLSADEIEKLLERFG